MKATPIHREKFTDGDGALFEIVAWKVPADEKHPEGVRYRLAFVPKGHKRPAVLYDNHHPKGHHKHIEGKESPYLYINVHQLRLDFRKDIEHWKKGRE